MLNQDGIVGNDYKPQYIERNDDTCPHCTTLEGGWQGKRTNRYLYRCSNPDCGRYW